MALCVCVKLLSVLVILIYLNLVVYWERKTPYICDYQITKNRGRFMSDSFEQAYVHNHDVHNCDCQADDYNLTGDKLSDVSKKDAGWDRRRGVSDALSMFYSALSFVVFDPLKSERYAKYAARLWKCAGVLQFALVTLKATGKDVFRLIAAKFCRVPGCLICLQRRSMLWVSRFIQILPTIIKDHPKAKWVFITLTVANPKIDDLRITLKAMQKGWKRLLVRKEIKPILLGYIKSVEVTREKVRPDYAHPHFHVLMLLPAFYWKGTYKDKKTGKDVAYYLSQERWTELWKSVMKLDYDPIVNVQLVKPKVNKRVTGDADMDRLLDLDRYPAPEGIDSNAWKIGMSGALECLKYTIKPKDLVPRGDNDPWLAGLVDALFKERLVSSGGVLKEVLADIENDRNMTKTGLEEVTKPGYASDLSIAFSVPNLIPVGQKRIYRRAPRYDLDLSHEQDRKDIESDAKHCSDLQQIRDWTNDQTKAKAAKRVRGRGNPTADLKLKD